jgi:hypothetical protein
MSIIFAAMMLAAPADIAKPGWVIEEKASMLDGKSTYGADLKAVADVTGILDRPGRPSLGFSCSPKGIFGSIVWPDFVSAPYDDPYIQISWKIS